MACMKLLKKYDFEIGIAKNEDIIITKSLAALELSFEKNMFYRLETVCDDLTDLMKKCLYGDINLEVCCELRKIDQNSIDYSQYAVSQKLKLIFVATILETHTKYRLLYQVYHTKGESVQLST